MEQDCILLFLQYHDYNSDKCNVHLVIAVTYIWWNPLEIQCFVKILKFFTSEFFNVPRWVLHKSKRLSVTKLSLKKLC